MLRTEELLTIKDQLVSMKNEILAALEEKVKSRDISEHRDIGDIFDDADIEQLREFNLMLTTRERQKLKQIEIALTKAERGEYGYCEDCGQPIPIGRLKAMPFATLCVKCKSERESLEGSSSAYIEEKG